MPRTAAAGVLGAVVACAVALAVLPSAAVAKSSCDVSVSGVSLASGAVYTAACSTSSVGAIAYRVSSNGAFRVYFTDGSDCSASTFSFYTTLSYGGSDVAAGATASFIVRSNYVSGEWAYPCVRVKNMAGATASVNVAVEWSAMNLENQFHLQNTGQYLGTSGNDVNAQGAWTASSGAVTGNGVVVDICDDGLQAKHVEIEPRIRLDLSQNMATGNVDPTGADDDDHGTGCGGVAAADGANSYCGRGAAYNAGLAGHRILFAGATDAIYAGALWNATLPVDISSNSWGPQGCTAQGCDYTAAVATVTNAIATAFVSGRQGRGKPFVFAAGNEGDYGGDCNQYAYTKMNEAITVAGSGYTGKRVYYSSAGACLFVNAPTQGQPTSAQPGMALTPGIITAQGGVSNTACRDDFGGTSSATPLVAGVIALVMEANPKATARDIHYLLRSTATQNDPTDGSWFTNGANVKFSRSHGFGRVDAGAAVAAARSSSWKTVAPLITSTTATAQVQGGTSVSATARTLTIAATSNVQSLENVILSISASWSTGVARLHISLRSPAGTTVDLAVSQPQKSGNLQNAFELFPFGARAFWGENPNGNWVVSVDSAGASGNGAFTAARLSFAGIATSCGCTDPNSVCAEVNGAVVCQCARGFTGSGSPPSCSASTTCNANPCQNGGTCVEGSGTYQCRCPSTSAMYDDNCNLKDSPCNPNPCTNNGTCILSGANTVICQCPESADPSVRCLAAAHSLHASFAAVLLAAVAAIAVSKAAL